MEETVKRYLNEEYYNYEGKVIFTCSLISVQLDQNLSASGTFAMQGNNLLPSKIKVYSDNNFINVWRNDEFEENIRKFKYEVSLMDIDYDEIISGIITFATDIGEFELPYEISRKRPEIIYGDKVIKTLQDFCELSYDSIELATKLFYSSDGEYFFEELGENEKLAYKLFSSNIGNQENVDEFLVYLGIKERNTFTINLKEINIAYTEIIKQYEIQILKKNNDELTIEIETQDDFIKLNNNKVTDDNFLGSECTIPFYINENNIKCGINKGSITLKSKTQYLVVDIQVTKNDKVGHSLIHKTSKREIIDLCRGYIDFRLKKSGQSKWVNDSIDVVDNLIDNNPNSIKLRLFQVQLLLTANRKNEAEWILNHIKNKIEEQDESTDIYCYYVYLTTLIMDNDLDIQMAVEKINFYYDKAPNAWVAWLLTYVNKEYRYSPSEKLDLLGKYILEGNGNVILYLEILNVYLTRPELLIKLGGVELEVLNFAIKNNMFSDELVEKVNFLAEGIKDYSAIIYRILKETYNRNGDVNLLSTICRLLIRENYNSEEYYNWYLLGVQNQVRVVNLYEFYMMSMPLDQIGQIEKQALLYFAYSNSLPSGRKMLLYLSILNNSSEEIKEMYKTQIIEFVKAQIKLKNVNFDLARLFDIVITKETMTNELATDFVKLIFKSEVRGINDDINNVIVVYPSIVGENISSCKDNKAIVSIYSKDAVILLENYKGERISADKCEIIELFDIVKWQDILITFMIEDPCFDWYISNEIEGINLKNISSIERMVRSLSINNIWKQVARRRLAEFYYKYDMIEKLDELIKSIDIVETSKEERSDLLPLLIKRGFYTDAYSMIERFGLENHEPALIVRLSKRLLSSDLNKKDNLIVKMLYYAYKQDNYDQITLGYLANHYEGQYKELINLYNHINGVGENSVNCANRIIEYVLFNNINDSATDIIIHNCMENNSEPLLIKAYMTFIAYLYIIDRRDIDVRYIEEWEKMLKKDAYNRIIALAYLKSIERRINLLSIETIELIKSLLEQLADDNIYLPFMDSFLQFNDYSKGYGDFMAVEYHSHYAGRVYIYYDEVHDTKKNSYRKLELTPIIGQSYVQTFMLFFGESIDYYFAEEDGAQEIITHRGTLKIEDMTSETHEWRYELLNNMQVEFTLQEHARLEKSMNEYNKMEYMTHKLFEII